MSEDPDTHPDRQTDQILLAISHRLDVATMVLVDILREVRSVTGTLALPEPGEESLAEMARRYKPAQEEARYIQDGDRMYIRQPLPGKHWLLITVDTTANRVDQLRIELPSGDQMDITRDELQTTFGIDIPVDDFTVDEARDLNEQYMVHPGEDYHPTDPSLNPDVEVPGER